MSEGKSNSWVMPAISAASQLAGGLFGWISNKKQRQHEQNMYSQQLGDSIRMWRMQNEYDSPSMQMKRLKDAGLNPNLVYGSGNVTATGNTINQPQMDVSQARQVVAPINPAGLMQDIYDMRYRDAQTDLARQQIVTQGSVAVLNTLTAERTKILMEMDQLKTDFERDTYQKRLTQLDLQIEKALSDIESVKAGTRSTNVLTDQMLAQGPVTIKKMLAEIDNIKAGTAVQGAELGLKKSMTLESGSRTLLNQVERQLKELEIPFKKFGSGTSDSFIQQSLKSISLLLGEGTVSAYQQILNLIQQLKGNIVPGKGGGKSW